MSIHKFIGHESAQARYITNKNEHTLQSYSTRVATVDNEGWLTVKGLYSRTTIKHIGWFMRMLADKYNNQNLTYRLAKQLYLDGMAMNLLTGEYKTIDR